MVLLGVWSGIRKRSQRPIQVPFPIIILYLEAKVTLSDAWQCAALRHTVQRDFDSSYRTGLAQYDCQGGVEVSNEKSIQEYFWETALALGFTVEAFYIERWSLPRVQWICLIQPQLRRSSSPWLAEPYTSNDGLLDDTNWVVHFTDDLYWPLPWGHYSSD